MSKEMTIIVLGLLVVVTPFLGIYTSWKTPLFVLAGLGVMLVGFLLRGESLSNTRSRRDTMESHPFVESHEAATQLGQEGTE